MIVYLYSLIPFFLSFRIQSSFHLFMTEYIIALLNIALIQAGPLPNSRPCPPLSSLPTCHPERSEGSSRPLMLVGRNVKYQLKCVLCARQRTQNTNISKIY